METKFCSSNLDKRTILEMKDQRGRFPIHPMGTCEDTFRPILTVSINVVLDSQGTTSSTSPSDIDTLQSVGQSHQEIYVFDLKVQSLVVYGK